MKRIEFIEKWLEALESGEYKQAINALRVKAETKFVPEYRYCCLGVACDLANELGVKKIDFDTVEKELLPKNMVKFLGITEDGSFYDNIIYRGKYYGSLTQLNDDGVKFKTIARIIREQLKDKNFEKPRR